MDNAGWLIPQRVQIARPFYSFGPRKSETLREYVLSWGMFRQNNKAEMEKYQQEYKQRYFIWTAGVFPAELRQQQRAASMEPTARKYPPIPAWLGEHPPLQAVLMPSGEILTYGELDLHILQDNFNQRIYYGGPLGERWYRYSADGKLLGTFMPNVRRYGDNSWRNQYADWDWLEGQLSAGKWGSRTTLDAPGGYRIYVELEREKNINRGMDYSGPKYKGIIAAYDWQGNLVDPDARVDVETQVGQLVNQQYLADIYKAQVALGLTDPKSQSPWAGTPEGPAVVDPTPRPEKVIAFGRTRTTDVNGLPQESWVELQPLGDPANPYRDEYGPWDHWITGQYNKRNPRENEYLQEQARKDHEHAEAAKKEGKPYQRGMFPSHYIPGADDLWQNVIVRVDENGWMIPLLKWQRDQNRTGVHDLRLPREQRYVRRADIPQQNYYTFEAGGVMPGEIRAQFAAALKQQRPDLLPPPVQPWLEQKLRERTASSVIFLPNGEVVTREPLPGEVVNPTQDVVSGEAQFKVPKSVWHRYSADGQLLGIADASSPWQQLYNPQLTSLTLSAQSQGLVPDMTARYLIWRKKNPNGQGGEATAAWDYDGSPLSLAEPLLEDRDFFRYWDATSLIKANMGVIDLRY